MARPSYRNQQSVDQVSDRTNCRARRSRRVRLASIGVLLVSAAGAFGTAHNANDSVPRLQIPDPDGRFANFNAAGPTDGHERILPGLGTNGRRCVTCHQPSDAFSVTPPHIRQRFEATQGMDPIFRPVDGANCPTADVSTVNERREAYSLLLTRGLIRIGIHVPANADYRVVSVTIHTDATPPISFPCIAGRFQPRTFLS
jgi:hypothetical protein